MSLAQTGVTAAQLHAPHTPYSPERVQEQFLGYIVNAVRVLEGQIELVVRLQHPEALRLVRSRTFQRSALAVHVHRNVFGQLVGVGQPVAGREAVRHEPRDLFGLAAGVVCPAGRPGQWRPVLHEVPVRIRDVAVQTVVGGHIEHVGIGNHRQRRPRRFHVKHDPNLKHRHGVRRTKGA